MTEATSVPINQAPIREDSALAETETPDATLQDEAALDAEFDELDEELIIEDFTIDGICGVY